MTRQFVQSCTALMPDLSTTLLLCEKKNIDIAKAADFEHQQIRRGSLDLLHQKRSGAQLVHSASLQGPSARTTELLGHRTIICNLSVIYMCIIFLFLTHFLHHKGLGTSSARAW